MNKKALVVGLSVLAAMVVGIAVLMVVLFGGSAADSRTSPSKKSEPLFCAVPSNAVIVAKFSDLREAVAGIAVSDASKNGQAAFVSRLASSAARLTELSERPLVVSMFYSKKLVPLFIMEAPQALVSTPKSPWCPGWLRAAGWRCLTATAQRFCR